MASVSVGLPRARAARVPVALAVTTTVVAVVALVGNGIFATGVLVGALLAALVRRAEPTAAARTERELARLGAEWEGDLPNAVGAAGHVVRRGSTVFRVDSVALPGRVEVAGSTLACGRHRMPLLLDAARGGASSLEGRVGRAVVPVLALWGDFAEGAAVVDGVAVVRGDRLAGWLGAPRNVPETVERVSSVNPS